MTGPDDELPWDDGAAAWAQLEQEQEQLRADPAFDRWLDQLELIPQEEHEHG